MKKIGIHTSGEFILVQSRGYIGSGMEYCGTVVVTQDLDEVRGHTIGLHQPEEIMAI